MKKPKKNKLKDDRPGPGHGAWDVPAEGADEETAATAQEAGAETAPVSREHYDVLLNEKNSLQDQMMRIAAEFENYRKRVAKEKSLWEIMVTKKALADMLTILTSINHGLQVHDAGSCAGLEAIRDQINAILDRTGVRPIKAAGRPFDPDLHEALFTEETGSVAPNTVMDEIEAGYMYQDTVLIPSKVKVSRAPAPSSAEESAEATDSKEPGGDPGN